jgi:hypothetical protein
MALNASGIAQAVRNWLFNEEPWVQSRVTHATFVVDEEVTIG